MCVYHKHHIIPKHMGGSDDKTNLVTVTIEKHAELHKQLWEDLGFWQDHVAWKMLSGQITRKEAIKIAQSEGAKNRKKRYGKENHFYGRSHTEETKNAISKKKMGSVPPNKGMVGAESKTSKFYEITDPVGNVYIIKGLSEFCRRNNLSDGAMSQVALGKFKQHKQYKCRRL